MGYRWPTLTCALPIAVCSVLAFVKADAQVLVVNDNNNITYNTDTLLNDLTAAGIVYDVYDMAASGGIPPTAALMDGYDQVIWYCSTDGVDLGFWDPDAQVDIIYRILDGRKTWIIGQDLLYAGYGAAPLTFSIGDFPTDFMGIVSYDVQSYGDDGNVGCPGMVVDPGVSGNFSPGFGWVFPTLWWVDGVTPTTDVTAIYAMGPGPYTLEGAISMLHFHPAGMNVMSTLFDPALIGTFNARVTFLQETLDYMDLFAGVALVDATLPGLQLSQNPVGDRVEVTCPEAITMIVVLDARGTTVLSRAFLNDRKADLDLHGWGSGTYIVSVTTSSGRRIATVLMKE